MRTLKILLCNFLFGWDYVSICQSDGAAIHRVYREKGRMYVIRRFGRRDHLDQPEYTTDVGSKYVPITFEWPTT